MSVDLETNLLSIATRPSISLCTSFIFRSGFMSILALIFSVLASIIFFGHIKPKNLPKSTQKAHFIRLSFILYCQSTTKASSGLAICCSDSLLFTSVYINLHFLVFLLIEHMTHQSLISCHVILQPERHNLITIQPAIHYE